MTLRKTTIFLAFLSLTFIACSKDETQVDIQEMGQQIGDIMASVDESGGSSGSYASVVSGHSKMVARLAPATFWEKFNLLPQANATSCYSASTFSGCSSNVITRDFGGCTLGAATFTGTVTITFVDASDDNICLITGDSQTITRVPNFTVTGRRGAELSVKKTGSVGQRITRTAAGVFSFTNDGIQRKFTLPGGGTLLDYTSEVTSAITVSGNSRNGRTMSGGVLKVTNNVNGNVCSYTPSAVTWDSSCNCPVQGSWSGSCTDGRETVLTIISCGQANLILGEDSETFTFDRCNSI